MLKTIEQHFQSQNQSHQVSIGHGRVERRTVRLWHPPADLPGLDEWAGLKTIIQVKRYRHLIKGEYLIISKPEIHYYLSSLEETAEQFAQRIRNYWHVENKVHHVRDVTQGEDASRIRTNHLPHLFTSARNLALNLFRKSGSKNIAQAQRLCAFDLDRLLSLFRMK
jgi:predicted transposase YbfD/YdcC